MIDKNLTIFIVDDELSIRNGLSKAINWEEFNIEVLGTAQDGLEAYEFIEINKPDIVITDIKMPNLNGLQLVQKVRELKLNTKFIIISGYDDFKYAQLAIKYGVKSYLLKPIVKSELISEVQAISNDLLLENNPNPANLSESNSLAISNHSLKEKFLSGLLLNEYKQKDEILKKIENYKLNITDTPLQVIIFNYEFLASTDDNAKKTLDTILKSVIKEKVDGFLKDTSFIAFEHNINNVVCIVNINSLITSNIDFIAVLCNNCINSIKNNNDFRDVNIYAGIGNVVGYLSFTGESYRTALESLSYKIYETNQRVFDSSIICSEDVTNISAYTMDNSVLIDAIYSGNKEEMLKYVMSTFDAFLAKTIPPPSFIRGICIYLVIDVQKGLSVYLDNSSELFKEKPYIIINQLPYLSQIKNWIITLFLDYISLIKDTCKYKKDPIVEKAKAFINNNIFKKITVEAVSAYVNLSTNYFTSYFKQKTNENISEYIINLKIDHAKNMLKTTNQSINDISLLLGYEDYRSFNRIFKKLVGKTPSDYRQIYNNSN